jgi:hypothetical protein
MSESWSTSQWGDDCGPKPKGAGAPGGTVTVTETGSELLFEGAGPSFSTANCFDPMPGLKRSSHSGGKRGWTTTCTSAPGDPRRVTISTKISATDDLILFFESGVYEFAIKDSVCKASVSRSRSLKLKQRAGSESVEASAQPSATPPPSAAPSSAPPPPEPAEPDVDCDPSAAPARFELRPARKLLRPGDSFTLRGVAFDDRGCRVDATPELSLEGDAALVEKCRLEGPNFLVAEDAPAGTVLVVARLRGQRVEASIEVTPPDQYAELLARRGLDARGEDDHAVVATIAAEVGSSATQSEDRSVERRNTILAIGGGVAGLFAIVALGLIVRGRRRRAKEDEIAEPAQPPAVAFFEATGGAMACAKCGSAFPAGTAFCSVDGTPLVPDADSGDVAIERKSVAPVSVRQGSAQKPGKVCATCGELYPAGATFCGADGTELMPING